MAVINSGLRTMLRYYIQDIDSTDWTDGQLDIFITIAAMQVVGELVEWCTEIGGPYTFDLDTPEITPDPVAADAPQGFLNLIVLKAACIIIQGENKKKASQFGFKIVDNKSTIDGREAVKGLAENLKMCQKNYTDSLAEFMKGNRMSGHSILSPYTTGYDTGISSG